MLQERHTSRTKATEGRRVFVNGEMREDFIQELR